MKNKGKYSIVEFTFLDPKFDTDMRYWGIQETEVALALEAEGVIKIISMETFDTREAAKEAWIKEHKKFDKNN